MQKDSTAPTKTSRAGIKMDEGFHREILAHYARRPDPEEHYKERFLGQLFQEKYTEAEEYKAKYEALASKAISEAVKAPEPTKEEKPKPNFWKWGFFGLLGSFLLILAINFSGKKEE